MVRSSWYPSGRLRRILSPWLILAKERRRSVFGKVNAQLAGLIRSQSRIWLRWLRARSTELFTAREFYLTKGEIDRLIAANQPACRSLLVGRLGVPRMTLEFVELLLKLFGLVGIKITGNGVGPLFQSALPLFLRPAGLALAQVEVAQMFVNGGIVLNSGGCLFQRILRQVIAAHLKVRPAQTIEIRRVARLELQRFLNVFHGFIQPNAAVRQHVAEVVRRRRVQRINGEHSLKRLLRLVVLFLPFENGTLHE